MPFADYFSGLRAAFSCADSRIGATVPTLPIEYAEVVPTAKKTKKRLRTRLLWWAASVLCLIVMAYAILVVLAFHSLDPTPDPTGSIWLVVCCIAAIFLPLSVWFAVLARSPAGKIPD
jgi:hypothetical protein